MRTHTKLQAILLVCSTLALTPGCVKQSTLNEVDNGIRTACELLALRQQEVLKVDAKQIIDKTCAVEGLIHDVREDLLQRQLIMADKAGVPTVPVSAARLADAPDGGP